MSTADERHKMAEAILNFEARRDKHGHLQIYKLPAGDGGGAYEVAGINERYHPDEARHLAELIEAGRHEEAEQQATEIIATFTDVVTTWTTSPAIESYLRDCAFNRGPRGAGRILQRAAGVKDDGVVGSHTRTTVAEVEHDPVALLNKMRAAREQYERDVAKRDESNKFWKGLVNRWNKALEVALTFLPTTAAESAEISPALAPELAAFDATDAAIANMAAGGEPAAAFAAPPSNLLSAPEPTFSAVAGSVVLPALRLGFSWSTGSRLAELPQWTEPGPRRIGRRVWRQDRSGDKGVSGQASIGRRRRGRSRYAAQGRGVGIRADRRAGARHQRLEFPAPSKFSTDHRDGRTTGNLWKIRLRRGTSSRQPRKHSHSWQLGKRQYHFSFGSAAENCAWSARSRRYAIPSVGGRAVEGTLDGLGAGQSS